MYIRYDNDFDERDTDKVGIWWVCTDTGEDIVGFDTEEQAEEALKTYLAYREEGQTVAVSRQYAGLW